MGCRSVPPQHLGVYFREMEQKGEPVEVAFTIGNDPYVTLCSQVSGSIFLDELAVAGAWMGRPVDVVKCETSDVHVPATSEIVIEGVLLPGVRRTEGPFGEFPGYYQAVTQQPVFKLKAITHRRDPIYVTALTGPPTTDNHVMATKALLSSNPKPSEEEVRDYLSGNICRCGTYQEVMAAVRTLAEKNIASK